MTVALAVPASAGERTRSGTYPNGVNYTVKVSVYDGYASGYIATGVNYETGTIVVYQCSGTGNCSNRVAMASRRNYYTWFVDTGNPYSYGHTYQSCGSVTFPNTPSYSNYCTDVAANSWTQKT
jgi:hypothetical protein